MKRAVILGTGILLAGCLAAVLGWLGFITYLQTRVATLQVSVAGSVDAVTIYSTFDPTTAVASVRTDGQETTTEIQLPVARKGFTLVQPRPVEYFFVSTIGEKHQRGPVICCLVSLFPEYRILTVRGLSEWEVKTR